MNCVGLFFDFGMVFFFSSVCETVVNFTGDCSSVSTIFCCVLLIELRRAKTKK